MSASHSEIAQQLSMRDDWQSLTAYDRALIACAEFVRRGQAVPAWIGLREVIGKGSPHDINRAKEAFRQQQQRQAMALEVVPAGLPPAIGEMAGKLWLLALDHAREGFRAERDAARAERGEAQMARDEAIAEQRRLTDAVTHLEETASLLREQLTAERASREIAERLSGEAAEARRLSEIELGRAITRLEGVERHALMRVEEVRQQVEADKAREITAQARRLQEAELREARLTQRFAEAERQLVAQQEALAQAGLDLALARQQIEAELARAVRAEARLAQPSSPREPPAIRRRNRPKR